MFAKLLVANRGEIAVRVMRTCSELGIRSVGVYSDADAWALHVRRAGESYRIGPGPATDSYLRIDTLIDVARASGAEAIHPGYGFLSENPAFAQACRDAGLVFVGPSPEAMRLLGSKQRAKTIARQAGVPVVPGYDGQDQNAAHLREAAREVGFPLLIKASAGGGGRGMRLVGSLEEFDAALESARREATAAFGDPTVLLERYIVSPRHIEFQVLADAHGNVIHLGDRECSVQRRHQKVIEESPSPVVSPLLRAEMGAAAVALMRAAGYLNTGTVEFLLGPSGEFYFLEVNTRLQVEHPVTEQVTGLDLVREQLRIAAGEPLTLRQEEVVQRGHSIEYRIYAEDPGHDYLPSTGTLHAFEPPLGEGIRNDVGVEAGDQVTSYYDSMLAKLIVSAPDRRTCIARSQDALRSYHVEGVRTNLPLLQAVLGTPAFREGTLSTDFLDRWLPGGSSAGLQDHVLLAAVCWKLLAGDRDTAWQSGPWRQAGQGIVLRFHDQGNELVITARRAGGSWAISLPGGEQLVECRLVDDSALLVRVGTHLWRATVGETPEAVHIAIDGQVYVVANQPPPSVDDHYTGRSGGAGHTALEAPMTGRVVKLSVAEGETVSAGQTVLVIEAMKMEHAIVAPRDGTLTRLHCAVGDVVHAGVPLAEVEE